MGREKIVVSKEMKEDMVAAIKDHFLKERGEELGNLASSFILDFIIEELAPAFYNMGVEDACSYIGERVEDARSLLR